MYEIPICDKSLLLYGNCPCAENPPTINGLETLTVEVNEEFDPLTGVTATDCEGNPLNVTVHEPVTPPIVILDGVYQDSNDVDEPITPEEFHRIYDSLEQGDVLHVTVWNEDKSEMLIDSDVVQNGGATESSWIKSVELIGFDFTQNNLSFHMAYRWYETDPNEDYYLATNFGGSPKYVYLIKEQ